MTTETASATGMAFRELRDVAIARAGAERWDQVARALPSEARAALTAGDDALIPDELFTETLNTADDQLEGGSGELARAVGTARAEAIVGPRVDDFGGDAFRFLREGASLVYENRANYGASSVEVAPKRAVLRLVAPEHVARRSGEPSTRGPLLAASFLERAIELISGVPHPPRYIGHAPRIDARFERPMVNLLFEFDLDEG